MIVVGMAEVKFGTSSDVLVTRGLGSCVGIAIYDPVKKVIGLVHAGWRGTVKEIAKKSVLLFKESFASRPQDIIACLGPSIGSCCYEVQDDVSRYFDKQYVKKNHLDLWLANKEQLLSQGVKECHVEVSGFCTMCHQEWFFSHRASSGKTGRMMAAMKLM